MLYNAGREVNMEFLFQAQLPLMLFFQKMETAFLDICSEIVTFFGEIPIPLLVGIFIYWCWDKRKGFVVVSSLMSAMMSMQVLKAIFRIPRPFMKYPELIQGKRQQTATGFSFPSGHSTTAAAFYGSLYHNFKLKPLRILCMLLIILVPISRMYLGVHWPMDIVIGTILGLVCAFPLAKLFEKIYDNNKLFLRFTLSFLMISILIALPLAITMDVSRAGFETLEEFKLTTLYRAIHNLMQNSSIAFGLFLGMFLDRRSINFKAADTARTRILSFIVGLASIAVPALLLLKIPFLKYTFEFITFSFVGVWATFLFPLIAVKLGWMGKEI